MSVAWKKELCSPSYCHTLCSCATRCFSYAFVAKVFSRQPAIVLSVTLIFAGLLSWLGLSQFGFPEFDDPYLGFKTRFTSISDRIVTLENLRREVRQLEHLENYPGEKLTGREWRRRRRRRGSADMFGSESDDSLDTDIGTGSNSLCTAFPLDDYARVALEISSSSLTIGRNASVPIEVISLICYFQKKIEEIDGYSDLCEQNDDRMCCPMWSLPNYISLISKRTDCANIQKEDIVNFQSNLTSCLELYRNETLNEECSMKRDTCPSKCHRGGFLHTAMYYTMDKSYAINNNTKYTMIVLPIPKSPQARPSIDHLQDAIASIQMPKSTVTLAGFDFGGKDRLFKRYLISDLQYVVIASVIIFVIVCLYTKSLLLTTVSFGVLTLSIGIAYFFYSAVFQISYFPFMNMLVTIIVMGIGTDGTLIVSVVWERHKARQSSQNVNHKETRENIMEATLRDTTATLLITTCTTAGAFFASLTSSITTVRCFSIFAGTAVIIGFALLYICVPTTLVLSEVICNYARSLLPQSSEKGKFYSKIVNFYDKVNVVNSLVSQMVLMTFRVGLDKLVNTKLWILSFLTVTAGFIWACVVVFHSPQFQLPNSEQFQLLASSHPTEKYDRHVEPSFSKWRYDYSTESEKMSLYFIWGVKAVDVSSGFDPVDNGKLTFDQAFSMNDPANQKWMKKLCGKLRKQSFYDDVANTVVGANYDSCFLDTMIKWMKRDCEHVFLKNETYKPCCKVSKFPYDEGDFSKCIGNAARDVYRTPALYFTPDVAGPKFFVLQEKSNNLSNNQSGQLATFTLRVRTNVTFSLLYDKMNAFHEEVNSFFQEEISRAPKGLENGFFASSLLDFFDLQNSLVHDTWRSVLLSTILCFCFLWVSSWSFGVALGAVFSIFAIVIVSSAILIEIFDWKLGVFESIAVTVAVGLSDFTAHHAIEFSKRKSVLEMTSPTFFSAVTTATMGLCMLTLSNVLVYQQIGSFFFVLVVVSWIYSVFFLSPILSIFEAFSSYILTRCNKLWSLEPGENGVTFFHNPTAPTYMAEESESNEDLSLESSNANASSSVAGRKYSVIMMEKWKLLKKFTQETTV